MVRRAVSADWPAARGVMAALIRARDWAATPLGPIGSWPQSLRTAVELMLASGLPASIQWGPEGIVLYNDAAIPLLADAHPGALGRPVGEAWPLPRPGLEPVLRRVLAGETVLLADVPHRPSRGGQVREARFSHAAAPLRDEAGAVSGVFVQFVETTPDPARDERQAFLLKLSDALRPLADPVEIQEAACRVLGEHVGANRVLYGDVVDEKTLVLRRNYVNGAEPLIATLDAESFGRDVIAAYRRREMIVFSDVWADPRYTEADRRNHAAIGVIANASLGLIKDGRWVAAMGMHQSTPRDWTPLEIALLEDTAERTWAAVERARAEAELRDLNETLERRVAEALAERKILADVFEGTDAMISVADRSLRLLAFNRPYADEVERIGGRRPQVGDAICDLYAGQPNLAAPVLANWGRAVAGETFAVTEEHGDPQRYRRSYERRFEPVRDREGRLMGAYQYATDVTERLGDQRRIAAAEAAHRAADALYRAYFQNSGEALFVVDVQPDGGFVIVEANPAHRAAMGFDVTAEPGRPLWEVLPPDVAEAVAANYRRVVETGTLQRYRERIEVGGRVIHAETVLVPVRDETGRIVRIVGSGRDMTAQVQAEEMLRQSQKMDAMGQLTGGVAHDFNNLLTPILGGLDRLQRRAIGDERDRKLIEGALQSAERARTLVQRLLAFARRQPLQPAAVDVAEIVRGMADLVASTTGPQIRVAMEVEPDLPGALADANQLEMAILNLAVNARDAMPDGGTLRISVADGSVGPAEPSAGPPPGRYVRLSVADTGIGMDEATRARAVEPFFSTKGIGRGTGLGLSMVHGLAAQLGGALAIRSAPGLGTHVDLWLPVAAPGDPAAAGASRGTEADPVAPGSGTVLLVDDEDLVRAAAADMLADLGYAVLEAATAEEALRRMDGGAEPDLVVTDHLMPGMNGTELAQVLRARRPGLPVLIISGYADVAGIAPDLPRLTKPFRRTELAASLQALKP